MRAVFGALCVFLALLASPSLVGGQNAVQISLTPVAESEPRAKPDRTRAAALPEGISIARQCAASTIMARVIDAAGTQVFYARYSRTAFDEMVAAGCGEVQQGCNTCRIRYTGCSVEDRAACTDGDCLAQVCKRQMICTSKSCSAYGDTVPPCEARFAHQACLASALDPPRQ